MPRSKRGPLWFGCVVLGLWAVHPHGSAALQPEAFDPAEDSAIACSPDRAVVAAPATVRLRLWTTQKDSSARWTVEVGKIHQTGRDAEWNFAGVPAGAYAATARVTAGSEPLTCTARVIVRSERPRDGASRLTGRLFLSGGASEEAGFGLYSYLILPVAPSPTTRDLYTGVLRAYFETLDAVSDLTQYVSPQHLNVTYLPVRRLPPAEIQQSLKNRRVTDLIEWTLREYDHARAKVLWRATARSLGVGPYLVSCRVPQPCTPEATLVQDFSGLQPDLANAWMREFVNQTGQANFRDSRALQSLGLRVRTVLSDLARGKGLVLKSVKELVAFSSS